jgi:hypothetical protein
MAHMLTIEEAVSRIAGIEEELARLRRELAESRAGMTPEERTKAFLRKCGGWEDTRTPEELIDEIYSSRTASDRGAGLFDEGAK